MLVVGGFGAGNSVELYDPVLGTWSSCATAAEASATCPVPTNRKRTLHTATLLGDGTVLAAGGHVGQNAPIVGPSPAADTATERYDLGPESGL